MAYTFNGTDQAMYYSAPVTSAPFTLALWFRRPTGASAAEAFAVLLDASDADDITDDMWTLRTNTDDTLRFRTGDGGTVANANTSNSHGNDTWSHAAIIATNSTSRRIILDGDWANSGTNAVDKSPDNIDRLAIGARYGDASPGEWTDGEICEVSVWNVALTQAEIESLAARLSALRVRPASLAFYAPLVRGTQDIIGGLSPTTT